MPREPFTGEWIDSKTIMVANYNKDAGIVTVVYPHADYPGTRRDASIIARRYGRNLGARIVFRPRRNEPSHVYRYALVAR